MKHPYVLLCLLFCSCATSGSKASHTLGHVLNLANRSADFVASSDVPVEVKAEVLLYLEGAVHVLEVAFAAVAEGETFEKVMAITAPAVCLVVLAVEVTSKHTYVPEYISVALRVVKALVPGALCGT